MSSDRQQKVYHLLLISCHLKSSFDVMHGIYEQFLLLGDRVKMYSLESFGQEFSEVVPMQENQKNLKLIDCVVVVGSNQTLMAAIRHYNCKNTPPILAIGDGTGPGLFNYHKFQAKDVIPIAINNLTNGSLESQKLMKLNCNINCDTVMEASCQLEIHRDMKQPIIILNLYLETENKAKVKIGVFRGDGLLISTPMGSYCKNLALNGALMSKTMQNIMITPICPLSMKFRPLCLPASSKIFIEIDPNCRTSYALLYFDEGGYSGRLNKNQLLRIRLSKYKINLVSNLQESCEQLFIKGLNNIIRWGESLQHMQMGAMMKKQSEI